MLLRGRRVRHQQMRIARFELGTRQPLRVIGDHPLQQAGLHAFATAGAGAIHQGSEDALYGDLCRAKGRYLHGGVSRPGARSLSFKQRHTPALGGNETFAHGVARIRALHTPAGNIQVHLMRRAPGRNVIRAECRQQHVGGRRCLLVLDASSLMQYLFAAQQQRSSRMIANPVAGNGNHCGTEISQHHTGQRGSRMQAEVQNTQSGQRGIVMGHGPDTRGIVESSRNLACARANRQLRTSQPRPALACWRVVASARVS